MEFDDSWARYFDLPHLPAGQPSLSDVLFPRCGTCGETCGDVLQ